MRVLKGILLSTVVVSLALTGCSSKKGMVAPSTNPSVSSSQSQGDQRGSGSTSALDSSNALNSNGLQNGVLPNGLTPEQNAFFAKKVVYFSFDSSEIADEDLPILSAHATYLKKNTGAKVTLAGHTDERGTREYNMALGERRAKAVEAYLLTNGVSSKQLDVVSYGKEMPAVEGHTESEWAKNRRVELKEE